MQTPQCIAVIWVRFGPYHWARLRAAASAAADVGVRIVGVEMASDDDEYAWDRIDSAEGAERVRVFPGESYHRIDAARLRSGIRQTLDRVNPDVVAINGWAPAEAREALRWRLRHKRRCIVMSESKADDRARVFWKEWPKRWIARRFDAALVGGESHAEYLRSLGFPSDRIHFGYDAVDNEFFRSGADAARGRADQLRAELRLPEDYFLVSTRLLKRKNVDGLLRAYHLYRRRSQSTPWGLVVLGSGEERERLERIERELSLDGISWRGFVQYPELPVYYGLASAFVHPAKQEAWGLVVNEAAASGLPLLVANSVGSAAELLSPGQNGYAFDPLNVDEIAEALISVASASNSERFTMGRKSQEIVEDWGPARFASGLLAAAGCDHAVVSS